MAVSFEAVALDKPEDVNVIVGQAHFIKTVEDLHEALAGGEPGFSVWHRILRGLRCPPDPQVGQ